ncbi:uncharacterized protein M6G45_002519 [Spheniscus humboldti]
MLSPAGFGSTFRSCTNSMTSWGEKRGEQSKAKKNTQSLPLFSLCWPGGGRRRRHTRQEAPGIPGAFGYDFHYRDKRIIFLTIISSHCAADCKKGKGLSSWTPLGGTENEATCSSGMSFGTISVGRTAGLLCSFTSQASSRYYLVCTIGGRSFKFRLKG